MSILNTDVLVVGAGPAGLTASALLKWNFASRAPALLWGAVEKRGANKGRRLSYVTGVGRGQDSAATLAAMRPQPRPR
jgi:succinate dehydrogenase/fumarate reductase flavoprotein subunit